MTNPFVQKLTQRFHLSHEDETALKNASAGMFTVGPRMDLIRENDIPDHLHLIQSGFACRYKVVSGGGRSIVAYLLPGDICDLNVSILGRMDHNIATLSVCEVVKMPREIVNDLTDNHPLVDRALRWSGLVDESIMREWLVGIGRKTAEQRLAHLFCELFVRLGVVGLVKGKSFPLPINQHDLADMTGLSNVHVNRVLQTLRKKQLISLREKTLIILDLEGLMLLADFNQNYLHLNPKQPSPLSYQRR